MMTYKMCDKCKRFLPWTPEMEGWSVLKTEKKKYYLCEECTEKLLKKLEEQKDEWRFIHG